MLSLPQRPIRQIALSFAAGVPSTARLTEAMQALAQVPVPSPTPAPSIDMQQTIEWCRQMMSRGAP